MQMKQRYYFEQTGSTNDDILRLAKESAAHGTIVVAKEQTAGRGRSGRDWYAPAGSNLYFSMLLRPDVSPDKTAVLTLVMALSVVQAIETCCELQVQIKWPNDIVCHGKKVCGILTELWLDENKKPCVIIGTGVNVNQKEFPEELREVASSLVMESGKEQVPEELLNRIEEKFKINYNSYLKTEDFTMLQESYEKHLVNKDNFVRVLDPQGEFTGVARGINDKGELLVERENGEISKVYAGEVSVRGLYGYT